MNFSPAKCYKDLMVEFLDMAVGGMSCFPGFEDYHREYLVDYDIEYLEELVKKFSKKGHTYFAFMAGMVYSTCLENWGKINEDLSDEENDEFLEAANAGLTSFMTLLGIEDFSMEEAFDMFDLDEENCNCDCDCEDEECNCCEKDCGNCDCKSCSDSFEDDCIDEDSLLDNEE